MDLAVLGLPLDWMVLKVFSNLNDSMSSRNSFLCANCAKNQNNPFQYKCPHCKHLKLIRIIHHSPIQRRISQICGMHSQEEFGNLPQICMTENCHTKLCTLLLKKYHKGG